MTPFEKAAKDLHAKEERRSGYVALSSEFIQELEQHMREENTLFRSIRLAAGVFSTLIIVLTWIFIEKNGDIKEMQKTLNDHSIAIAKTLVILETQLATTQKLVQSHDRLEERVNSYITSGPRSDDRIGK
jgi:hypothetical protein